MYCKGKLKLRSHNTSYCLKGEVTKASWTSNIPFSSSYILTTLSKHLNAFTLEILTTEAYYIAMNCGIIESFSMFDLNNKCSFILIYQCI